LIAANHPAGHVISGAFAAILFDWDHGRWESPDHIQENSYDILAKQIIRLVLEKRGYQP
jgi:hypothetical protein